MTEQHKGYSPEFSQEEVEVLNLFGTVIQDDSDLRDQIEKRLQERASSQESISMQNPTEMLNTIWQKISQSHERYATSTS